MPKELEKVTQTMMQLYLFLYELGLHTPFKCGPDSYPDAFLLVMCQSLTKWLLEPAPWSEHSEPAPSWELEPLCFWERENSRYIANTLEMWENKWGQETQRNLDAFQLHQ